MAQCDDDEDVTDCGSSGHLDWCRECGREAAIDGEPRDSCDFKNWDECNAWHDGYAEGLNWRAMNTPIPHNRGE
jgi:ribosome modulation factor